MSTHRWKQLWTLTGSAPDPATRRDLLRLFHGRSPDMVLGLLTESARSGPRTGTVPRADLPDPGTDPAGLILYGALLNDPDDLRAAAAAIGRDADPVCWAGIAMNPHTPARVRRTAQRNVERTSNAWSWGVGGALFERWVELGHVPDARVLAGVVGESAALASTAIRLFGVDEATINAIQAHLPDHSRDMVRRDLPSRMFDPENDPVPSAVIRWMLADSTYAPTTLNAALTGDPSGLLASDVLPMVLDVLTRSVPGLLSSLSATAERFVARFVDVLTGEQVQRLLAVHPRVARTLPAGTVEPAAVWAPAAVVVDALADRPGPVWVSTARLLATLDLDDVTPLEAVVDAAAGAASGG